MKLEQISLMNFDLVKNGEFENKELHETTNFYLKRLAHLGVKFKHFSYTTFSEFEITKNSILLLLKNCEVGIFLRTMLK